MLKQLWNWYNGLTMSTILGSAIVTWMTLSILLLHSWFLVAYVFAHCLTTGIFVAAIVTRMPKGEKVPASQHLAFSKDASTPPSGAAEQRASA